MFKKKEKLDIVFCSKQTMTLITQVRRLKGGVRPLGSRVWFFFFRFCFFLGGFYGFYFSFFFDLNCFTISCLLPAFLFIFFSFLFFACVSFHFLLILFFLLLALLFIIFFLKKNNSLHSRRSKVTRGTATSTNQPTKIFEFVKFILRPQKLHQLHLKMLIHVILMPAPKTLIDRVVTLRFQNATIKN